MGQELILSSARITSSPREPTRNSYSYAKSSSSDLANNFSMSVDSTTKSNASRSTSFIRPLWSRPHRESIVARSKGYICTFKLSASLYCTSSKQMDLSHRPKRGFYWTSSPRRCRFLKKMEELIGLSRLKLSIETKLRTTCSTIVSLCLDPTLLVNYYLK